jgi:hypothetical protein
VGGWGGGGKHVLLGAKARESPMRSQRGGTHREAKGMWQSVAAAAADHAHRRVGGGDVEAHHGPIRLPPPRLEHDGHVLQHKALDVLSEQPV